MSKPEYIHFRRWPEACFWDGKRGLVRAYATKGEVLGAIGGFGMSQCFQRGGATIAMLRSPEGAPRIGVAVCSDDDPFSRADGRRIALARARKAYATGALLVAPQGREALAKRLVQQIPARRLLGL